MPSTLSGPKRTVLVLALIGAGCVGAGTAANAAGLEDALPSPSSEVPAQSDSGGAASGATVGDTAAARSPEPEAGSASGTAPRGVADADATADTGPDFAAEPGPVPEPAVAADATPNGIYADWTLSGANPSWSGTTTLPGAVNFPPATYGTNSTTPTIPSGTSAFLGPSTPFGAVFGSSEAEAYLSLRTAAGITPSTTTFTFDTATPPFGWGFALGDIDADSITISGADKTGRALTAAELGFTSVFNYCMATPQPGSCTTGPFTDVPTWDLATATLTGNVADTQGAAAWFMPTERIRTLTFVFSALSGNPIYQVWFAAVLGEIAGDVTTTDPSGTSNPASGVALTLGYPDGDSILDQSGNPIRPKTGADGSFVQTGLVAGTYDIAVIPPPGYTVRGAATLAAVASTPAGDPVQFALTAAGAGPGPAPSAGGAGEVAALPARGPLSDAGSRLPGTGGGGVLLTLAALLVCAGLCLTRTGELHGRV